MNDLLEVLRGEVAPLELWLALAKVYLSQGNVNNFLRLMEEACSPEAEEFYEAYSRIRMFCALAAYYTHRGRTEKGHQRNEAFNTARQLLQEARRIDFSEQLPVLGMAQLALAQGNALQAKSDFESAKNMRNNGQVNVVNGQVNVAPAVALANMALQAGQVDEALRRYKKALRDHPRGPPELRLGIAVCCYRKGNFSQAKAAFERVLELDPRNIDAMHGLAVMKFNSDSAADKREALELLQDAYHWDPTNSAVLNMLAHQYLLRGDYGRVEALARSSAAQSSTEKTRAQSFLLLARAAHAMRKFPEAAAHYQQAAQLDKGLALPHFGLAQMNLHNLEYKNAISELESVLQIAPSSVDALRVIGRLYKQQPQRVERAISTFFEKFDKKKEGLMLGAEVWEMFGELQATGNPKEALSAYTKALELIQQGGGTAMECAQMVNNTAVLTYRLGDVQEAKHLMKRALEHAAADGGGQAALFNMARVHEASSNFKEAAELYKELLEEHPGYTACYLRLAHMEKVEGRRDSAQDWVQKALDRSPRNRDALTMMAMMHMERRRWLDANNVIKELLDLDKDDPCSLVMKGNLALISLPTKQGRGQEAQDLEKARKDHFGTAMHSFQLALGKDSSNAYAANGIGVVLAEEGDMATARSVFTQVQEAVAANPQWQIVMPDAHLNLANVYLACQDYVSAIKMYQAVLKRHYNNKDAGVLLYLARAHYDSEALEEAKRILLKAIHVAPTDPRLRFNLALAMQQNAAKCLQAFKAERQTPSGRLKCAETAQEELRQALRLFSHLHSLGHASTGIEEPKLKAHITYCKDIAEKAKVMHDNARREVWAAERKLDSQRLALESQKMQAQIAQEKQRQREQREKEEREKLALEQQRKLERLREQWEEEKATMATEAKEPKRPRKRPEDDFIDENPYPDALDELEERAERIGGETAEGEPRFRLKKRQRDDQDDGQRASLAAAGLDSDDEGAPAGPGPDRNGSAGDGDEPEARRMRRGGGVLDDDDDDEDGGGGGSAFGDGEGPKLDEAKMNDLFGSDEDD
eukprot:CAMPEP_0177627260 /NCGR_PEP_ID=MMETSP0419_2-20121207/31106_1 /TAXON_ID=582737 /ORGANISM="Tetraselmis sp., Strain GSL018" /LENGTH=1041 /DNA_ID=CAMNT_0019128397 /DNA_START=74 /DNA_END=3200 /DNA_ORIENTATION=+